MMDHIPISNAVVRFYLSALESLLVMRSADDFIMRCFQLGVWIPQIFGSRLLFLFFAQLTIKWRIRKAQK